MTPMEQKALDLAREMIKIDTCNPPGNEAPVAHFLAGVLEGSGFKIRLDEFSPQRPNLIATLPGEGKPLCLSGHMDCVPLGAAPWSMEPFGAKIKDGKLYGRGSADMKGGLGAIAAAALQLAALPDRKAGLVLAFSGDEETGCNGASKMASQPELLGGAGAILVAEPSDCIPRLGHKGAFWYLARCNGKAAHGSMPKEGVNAIYKAARAIGRLSEYQFKAEPHPMLGPATLNVGTVTGGTKVNMVPDRAEFGIDVRTIPGQTQEDTFQQPVRSIGRRGRTQPFPGGRGRGLDRRLPALGGPGVRNLRKTDRKSMQSPGLALFHRCFGPGKRPARRPGHYPGPRSPGTGPTRPTNIVRWSR